MSGSSTSLSNQQKQPDPGTSSAHVPVGKLNDRVDQLALVQSTLQNGATPTFFAGISMILAQMQTQDEHSDVILTISSSIGSLVCSACSKMASGIAKT